MSESGDRTFEDCHVVIAKRDDGAITGEFVDALRAADVSGDVRVVEAADADDATRIACAAAAQDAASVAAIGGDGTINLVAAGLADSKTPLAVGAAGTVNLLAQVLGVTTFDATADAIVAGRFRQFDVGETSSSSSSGLFVLNASSGFDAAVIDDADDHGDARFGRLHFALAGARRLRRDRPRRVTVVLDDRAWFDGWAMSVVVMNVGQRASADLDIAPDAAPDDGLLDVAVMRCSSVRRVMRVAWRLVRGRPVDRSDVLYGQGERIDVTWSGPVPVQRDGDADGSARSISHAVRPGALGVFAAST